MLPQLPKVHDGPNLVTYPKGKGQGFVNVCRNSFGHQVTEAKLGTDSWDVQSMLLSGYEFTPILVADETFVNFLRVLVEATAFAVGAGWDAPETKQAWGAVEDILLKLEGKGKTL